jgi:hypothetical protein
MPRSGHSEDTTRERARGAAVCQKPLLPYKTVRLCSQILCRLAQERGTQRPGYLGPGRGSVYSDRGTFTP